MARLVQLLEYGASVHATCAKGRTALHHLVKQGDILNTKMLNLLLDAGSSPFCADNKGGVPGPAPAKLHCALPSLVVPFLPCCAPPPNPFCPILHSLTVLTC